jgi:hypothetical protein
MSTSQRPGSPDDAKILSRQGRRRGVHRLAGESKFLVPVRTQEPIQKTLRNGRGSRAMRAGQIAEKSGVIMMMGNCSNPTRRCRALVADASAMALLAGVALAALAGTAAAQDATWLLNPATGDFNTDGNWTPATVPTGTASFGASNTVNLTFSAPTTTIGRWTFDAGASNYTFTNNAQTLDFVGAGIVVNGGGLSITNNGTLQFFNSSSAGGATITNNFFG